MKKIVITLGFAILFSGCAHISQYGFIDQKLMQKAINNSVNKSSKMEKIIKNENVFLIVNGFIEKEQSEYVKSIIEKKLTDNGTNICSLDKANLILNIRIDVLGTIQDDEEFGYLYHTSKRIGQARVHFNITGVGNKRILLEGDLIGCAMWTELYILGVFGPIRNYHDDIVFNESNEGNTEKKDGDETKDKKKDTFGKPDFDKEILNMLRKR